MNNYLKRIAVFFVAGVLLHLWQALLGVKIEGDNALLYGAGMWIIILAASDISRWAGSD